MAILKHGFTRGESPEWKLWAWIGTDTASSVSDDVHSRQSQKILDKLENIDDEVSHFNETRMFVDFKHWLLSLQTDAHGKICWQDALKDGYICVMIRFKCSFYNVTGIPFVKISDEKKVRELGIPVPSLVYFENKIPHLYEGDLEDEDEVSAFT